MPSDFVVFGSTHWLILAAVAVVAWLLTRWARGSHARQEALRVGLGVALLVSSIVWWARLWMVEGWAFPGYLPLQLCDITLITTGLAALTTRQRLFEFSYYGGLVGAGMALLTPDLWGPGWNFRNVHFFVAHGLIVITLVVLTATRRMRPLPGSVWRTLLVLNVVALFVGIFDFVFRTNYMYLREKPMAGSLMDLLGPWPWYLLGCEALALGLFWLLWLPFRKKRLA